MSSVIRETGVKVKHTGTAGGLNIGSMLNRFSNHQASKPGHDHKPHQTRQQRRTELTAQVAATGQYAIVLPPQHRIRRDKLEPARPLNAMEREARYRLSSGNPLSGKLTPAQARRIRKKRNHSVAKAAGR